MKKNDLIALIVALVLLVGVGYYYLSQHSIGVATASTTANQVVEIVPTINPTLDSNGTLDKLSTTYKVQDYKQPVVLTGLGNPAPFGQ